MTVFSQSKSLDQSFAKKQFSFIFACQTGNELVCIGLLVFSQLNRHGQILKKSIE